MGRRGKKDRVISYAVSNFSGDIGGDTRNDVSDSSDASGDISRAVAAQENRVPEALCDESDTEDAAAHISADQGDDPQVQIPGETSKPPSSPSRSRGWESDGSSTRPRSDKTASALPVMALPADDPETHIDEARLRSALALRKLPLSPRQFYTGQRANVVSLLGIIAAVGSAGWYVSN